MSSLSLVSSFLLFCSFSFTHFSWAFFLLFGRAERERGAMGSLTLCFFLFFIFRLNSTTEFHYQNAPGLLNLLFHACWNLLTCKLYFLLLFFCFIFIYFSLSFFSSLVFFFFVVLKIFSRCHQHFNTFFFMFVVFSSFSFLLFTSQRRIEVKWRKKGINNNGEVKKKEKISTYDRCLLYRLESTTSLKRNK